MKTLIVYYSLEGNCATIAKQIQDLTNGDILELEPVKDMRSKGLTKYIWGGSQVIMNKKPQLKPINISIEQYERIFIGSPIWASNFAPAIQSFLALYPLENKKVALFCTHQGGPGKALEKMENNLQSKNTMIGSFDIANPHKMERNVREETVAEWVKDCISK